MEIQNIYAFRDIIREYEYVKDVLLLLFRFVRGSIFLEKVLLQIDQVLIIDGLEILDFDDSNYEYIYIEDWLVRFIGIIELKGGDCVFLIFGGNL